MGKPKIEHDSAVVANLLNRLQAVSNDLEVKKLSSGNELPDKFIPAVKNSEAEFDDMITCLREYQTLFKSDIARIRKASEEIVSNEKQVASQLTATLEAAINAGAKASTK